MNEQPPSPLPDWVLEWGHGVSAALKIERKARKELHRELRDANYRIQRLERVLADAITDTVDGVNHP